MAAISSHGIFSKRYNFLVNTEDPFQNEALSQLQKDCELLRNGNPFRVVEMALEIQVERMRVVEAMKARDSAVHRLLDAYILLRQHSELIDSLQRERENHGLEKLETSSLMVQDTSLSSLKAHIAALETTIEDLRDINACLKEYGCYERKMLCDPPPHYEEESNATSIGIQTDVPPSSGNEIEVAAETLWEAYPEFYKLATSNPESLDIAELIKARNNLLANIALPPNPPDMTLVPIVLPPQVTLHEFLNSTPASLRNSLGNYRILQNVTTTWCPEREEHGFMYAPMFKCSTNPRAITAHRWSSVDVIGRMAKSTECFFNTEGAWYYAGSYKAFNLGPISTKEWEGLSTETTSALIKETLAARKNTTPQNNYETGQLYACGALKAACVGLQCVGFNQEIYRSISELAVKFAAKWKAGPPTTVATTGSGSVSVGMSSSSPSSAQGSRSSSVAGTPLTNAPNSTPLGSGPFLETGIGTVHEQGHRHSFFAYCRARANASNSSIAHNGVNMNSGGGGTMGSNNNNSNSVSSPLSTHGSGPCTPSMPASALSTPGGLSPIGGLGGSGGGGAGPGGAGGLCSGSGSGVWNASVNGATGLHLGVNANLGLGGSSHSLRGQPATHHHLGNHAVAGLAVGAENVPIGTDALGFGGIAHVKR